MTQAPVTLTPLEDGIMVLRLDDEAGENRLSPAVCDALERALDSMSRDPDVRVLILAGRVDVFCAGAPADVLEALAAGTPGLHVRDLDLPVKLLGLRVPVVAALEGHAIGGGLALALCCDMRVAATTRRYGTNFTDLGFTPGMGTTALLPLLAGHALATEMLMTAKLFRGAELAGCGLFNAVVPPQEVFETARGLARRLAEKPRHVLELLKDALAGPRRVALQEALAREHLMHQICFARPETAAVIRDHYLGGSPALPERNTP